MSHGGALQSGKPLNRWRDEVSAKSLSKSAPGRKAAVQETAVPPPLITSPRVYLAHIGSYGANRDRSLCQNCVRYPLKPRSNTVIYGAIPMHIVVAGSR